MSPNLPRLPVTNLELENAIFRALRKAIIFGIGLYVLMQFLGAVTFLMLFFGLVLLIAAALNPVVAWLQRHRVPRSVSAAVLALLVFGSLGMVLWLSVPPILREAQQITERGPQIYGELRVRVDDLLARYPLLKRQVPGNWDALLEGSKPYLTHMAGRAGQYAVNAGAILVSLFLMVILIVYTLASPQPLVAGVLGAVPERHRDKAQRIMGLIMARLKAWAIGSLILGAVMGTSTGLFLWWRGMPFALVFGFIAAIGELIPNLGPLLSAAPPILVALATSPSEAVIIAVFFIIAQQLENMLLVPLVMGKSLNLHPISVAFMLLVMGALFGIVGAIIAVPAATIIKTLYEELYLMRQVSDPDAILEQSERVVSDEGEPASEGECVARSGVSEL